ncbi:hypothetical protein GCM10018962_55630 [Dactylosporangium matsuzakiense]|uniref:TIR domain-containing protein n=1 Tax=Dactylosporangium matsuzakiense TaxID=53360 RepID=A0A9W6KF61_9ACTN|nr:hypothetical protein GCM10017581_026870 [Dactylosporangium matsuzakiense]
MGVRARTIEDPAAVPVPDARMRANPRAPIFFLSYARSRIVRTADPGPDPNQDVVRLFDDLTNNVNELVGAVTAQGPGYIDRGLEAGDEWSPRLIEAVGSCGVFVCLLSRPYLFQSTWGPREWDLFSRRRVVRRSDGLTSHETAIVPVLWTPIREDLPPPVAAVNVFAPTGMPREHYVEQYRDNGLLGLMRTGEEQVYRAIVWKLSMHIQRLYSEYWVEPGAEVDADDLMTSFAEAD